MKNSIHLKTIIKSYVTILLFAAAMLTDKALAQNTLEMVQNGTYNSYPPPVPSGSATTTPPITLYLNTNGSSANSNVYSNYTPTTTVTVSLENQQFSNIPGGSYGMVIGNRNSGGNGGSPINVARFSSLDEIGSPTNEMFTSHPTLNAGSGFNVNTAGAVPIFLTTEPLQRNNSSKSYSQRHYFGRMVLRFNRRVSNPVISIGELGGYVETNGNRLNFSTEIELVTSGLSFTRRSGNNNLAISNGNRRVANVNGNLGAGCSDDGVCGSVRIDTPTPVTQIEFDLYLRPDGGPGPWSNSAWTGDYWTLSVSLDASCPAPQITSHPAPQTVCPGGSASLSASASNGGSVQWQYLNGATWTNLSNTAPYSGVTGNTLNISSVTPEIAGRQYRLFVNGASSACGTATSNTAVVNIAGPPVITTQPSAAVNACVGAAVTITSSVTGGTTYQWQSLTNGVWTNVTDGGGISGATTPNLTFSAVTAGMNGMQLQLIASNSGAPEACRTTTSNTVTISVATSPTVTIEPLPALVCVNSSTSINAVVQGATSVQWQYYNGTSWVNITNSGPYSGVNTNTLNIASVPPAPSGIRYRIMASVQSDPGPCPVEPGYAETELRTINPPLVRTHPGNASLCAGGTVSFTADITEDVDSLQWQYSDGSTWTNIIGDATYSGVNTERLTVTNVNSAISGRQFRLVGTNKAAPVACNTAITNAARLTVPSPPQVKIQPENILTCAGRQVVFTAVTTSDNLTGVRWQYLNGSTWTNMNDDDNVSGVRTMTLTIKQLAPEQLNLQVRLLMTNANAAGCNSTFSNIASVTIDPECTPLPVTLVSFTADALVSGEVELKWTTAQEQNNKAFEIERSRDGVFFEKIARIDDVAGDATTNNNYLYVDKMAVSGRSYYRLRQIDADGTFNLSRIITVTTGSVNYSVYPNPLGKGMPFRIEVDEPESAKISCFNVRGETVTLGRKRVGENKVELNFNGKVTSGLYIIQVYERGAERLYKLLVE